MIYKGKLYAKFGRKFIELSQTSDDFDKLKKEAEIQRIEGVLLGLFIAKKAWDKGLAREEIYENEILYTEELEKLKKQI